MNQEKRLSFVSLLSNAQRNRQILVALVLVVGGLLVVYSSPSVSVRGQVVTCTTSVFFACNTTEYQTQFQPTYGQTFCPDGSVPTPQGYCVVTEVYTVTENTTTTQTYTTSTTEQQTRTQHANVTVASISTEVIGAGPVVCWSCEYESVPFWLWPVIGGVLVGAGLGAGLTGIIGSRRLGGRMHKSTPGGSFGSGAGMTGQLPLGSGLCTPAATTGGSGQSPCTPVMTTGGSPCSPVMTTGGSPCSPVMTTGGSGQSPCSPVMTTGGSGSNSCNPVFESARSTTGGRDHPKQLSKQGVKLCSGCGLYKVVGVNCAGCGRIESLCVCRGTKSR